MEQEEEGVEHLEVVGTGHLEEEAAGHQEGGAGHLGGLGHHRTGGLLGDILVMLLLCTMNELLCCICIINIIGIIVILYI